jgi:hypothetical protein
LPGWRRSWPRGRITTRRGSWVGWRIWFSRVLCRFRIRRLYRLIALLCLRCLMLVVLRRWGSSRLAMGLRSLPHQRWL